MIILLGESGVGKTSVEKELVKNFGFKKIISYTTRPPRIGETDGVDYYFVSEDKFREMDKQFLFAETAEYNGWFYGSTTDDYTNAHDKTIKILTPSGLREIRRKLDIDLFSIYLTVPERDRLIKLLQRGDNIQEAYRRCMSDTGQFDGVKNEVDICFNNCRYKYSVKEVAKELSYHFIMHNVNNKYKLINTNNEVNCND